MGWVFERPIKTKKLEVIQEYLTKRLHDKNTAFLFVKLLSLGDFLRRSEFKSPTEIRESVYYDEEKTHPVFDASQSQKVFRLLKQSGGASEESQVFDHGIRVLISKVRDYTPNFIVNVSDIAYPYVTLLKSLQRNSVLGPWVEIVKETAVQTGTTAIVTADMVAADLGGPVGEAVVAIPAAIAGMGIVATHIAADELGDALLASFLVLPFVGPILYKAAVSFGKVANKVSKRKGDIVQTTRSVLGDSIAERVHGVIPELRPRGGKEFSSRRHRAYKWRMKTQRN